MSKVKTFYCLENRFWWKVWENFQEKIPKREKKLHWNQSWNHAKSKTFLIFWNPTFSKLISQIQIYQTYVQKKIFFSVFSAKYIERQDIIYIKWDIHFKLLFITKRRIISNKIKLKISRIWLFSNKIYKNMQSF